MARCLSYREMLRPCMQHSDREVAVLVLSRKRNEKIVIGEDITVTVLEVRGDQVQIGIDAPRTIPVHRHEVYVAIHEGEEKAPEAAADPSSEPTHWTPQDSNDPSDDESAAD